MEKDLLKIDHCMKSSDNHQTPLSSIKEAGSVISSDTNDNLPGSSASNLSVTYKGVAEKPIEDANCQAIIEFQQILKNLEDNPYIYNNYVKLCDLSHQIGDLDRIRKSYSSFSDIYPLIPKFWKRYIDVELKEAEYSKNYHQTEVLYRKALNDYYSCNLAKGFVSIAKHCGNPLQIWDEVLSVYGLHFMQGNTFYELYRKYLQNRKESSIEECIQLCFKSYLNELRYPLYQMEDIYIEFKVFFEKNKALLSELVNWEEFEKEYFAVKAKISTIMSFEQKLSSLDKNAYRERAEVYFEYLHAADEVLDSKIMRTIYERMVADCCLNSECWMKYIDFVYFLSKHENGEGGQFTSCQKCVNDISKRSIRNCCWSPELYIKRIHLLEKLSTSREEVQEVIELAVSAGFEKPEHIVDIWLDYLTYLRRQTNFSNESDCDILRKNFDLAWTTLGHQWGALADCNCEILQLWGRLEYGPLQNPLKGRELWNIVMESSDNSTKSGLWIEFCMLEKLHDLEATRKLFIKGIRSVGLDDPKVLISSWKGFERNSGSIKSLEKCLHECQLFLKKYEAEPCHLYLKPAVNPRKVQKRKQSPLPNHSQPKLQKPNTLEDDFSKDGEQNDKVDIKKDNLRVFLSNMDYNITEEDVRKGLPELQIVSVELIRLANGRNRGFGYVELLNEDEVKKALELDRKMFYGRPLYISSILRDKEQRQSFKYSTGVEPSKLFVKNLPNDCTKNDLEDIFSAYGMLKDIRLVHHKSGKFKNMAFVEYEDESSAGKAVLGTNKMNLRSHTISVDISAPPHKPVLPKNILIQKRPNKIFEQKPKIALIPSVIKRKMANETTLNRSESPITKKTNADFQKMFAMNNINN